MTQSIDVAVIGAGPAGAAAARLLAAAGLDVRVFDKAAFPRDKCCGDGLTALALRELESLGLDPGKLASFKTVQQVTVRSPAGRQIRYSLPIHDGLHGAVARREELDAALVELARDAGASVCEGVALKTAVQEADGVGIGFGDDHRPLKARLVLAADGMWSPTRRALGLGIGAYRGEWHAFRQYFRGVSDTASEELVVWFERDLLPGYAWSFPLGNGRANVGFGIQRERHRVGDMRQTWIDLLSRGHVRRMLGPGAEPESPHRAWPIPARIGRLPLVGPRTMFAGDAAGACDPMTGEGIGQALVSGRIAAETVIAHDRRGLSDPADLLGDYERRVRRELIADDRMARALIPLLARPRIARAALGLTATTEWTRRNFVRWMFEDYPRAILATPRRWQRRALSPAGAFTDAGAHAGAGLSGHRTDHSSSGAVPSSATGSVR